MSDMKRDEWDAMVAANGGCVPRLVALAHIEERLNALVRWEDDQGAPSKIPRWLPEKILAAIEAG